MNRRHFLNYFKLAGLVAMPLPKALGSDSVKKKKEQYLVCGSSDEIVAKFADFQADAYLDAPGKIAVYDFASRLVQTQSLPVSVHQFVQSRSNPSLIAGCGKYAPTGILFDLATKKIVRTFKAPKDHRFQGHCVFSESGHQVIFTAQDYKKNSGQLLSYSTDNGELVSSGHSGGGSPHHCLSLRDGRLAIANADSTQDPLTSNITIFSANQLKLIDQIKTDKLLHLAQIDDEHLAGCGLNEISEARLSLIELRNKKVKKSLSSSADYPSEKIYGELLSIISLGHNLVACTLATTSQVILWDYKTHRFSLTQLPEQTFGVAWKNEELWVNLKNKGELVRFSVLLDSQLPKLKQLNQGPPLLFANGRHSTYIEI